MRPNDPLAKKLSSTGTETQNVLIKVTIPKKTGRKRKRGSNDAFVQILPAEQPSDSITASELLQRLRDNADQHSVQAVGMIQDTHRFYGVRMLLATLILLESNSIVVTAQTDLLSATRP